MIDEKGLALPAPFFRDFAEVKPEEGAFNHSIRHRSVAVLKETVFTERGISKAAIP